MATVDSNTLRERLNLALGDANNVTFTETEKNEMLRKAIADPMVYSIIEITTPVVASQRAYAMDDAYEQVVEVGYDSAGDGFPVPLPGDAYDFVDGNIIINRSYMNLVGGQNLYPQVVKKWVYGDNIPDYLGEYIVEKAVVHSAQFLANKKVNLFLRNKTTMGELMARINEAKQTVRELRRSLQNQKLVRI